MAHKFRIFRIAMYTCINRSHAESVLSLYRKETMTKLTGGRDGTRW